MMTFSILLTYIFNCTTVCIESQIC